MRQYTFEYRSFPTHLARLSQVAVLLQPHMHHHENPRMTASAVCAGQFLHMAVMGLHCGVALGATIDTVVLTLQAQMCIS
jgi:hypothetical protein